MDTNKELLNDFFRKKHLVNELFFRRLLNKNSCQLKLKTGNTFEALSDKRVEREIEKRLEGRYYYDKYQSKIKVNNINVYLVEYSCDGGKDEISYNGLLKIIKKKK